MSNSKTIVLSAKTAYGRELIYPECPTSKILVKLIKAKTFTKADLKAITELGYKITWAAAKVDF